MRIDNKVLHILTSLDFGGVESRMEVLHSVSVHSTFKHAYCAIGDGGSIFDNMQNSGADVIAFHRKTKIPSIASIVVLFRHLRKTRPAIVHLHGAEANFHGVIAAWLAGVPVVVAEEIGIPNHSLTARKIFQQIYLRCDRIVAISKAVANSISAMGEAKPDQITVIHNPFRVQPFRPLPIRGDVLRLGFVGRLEAVKNPLCAIETIALLRARGVNAELRIIGEGSQRSLLEKRIAVLNLGDQISLVGFHPRPFDVLDECHFYLQPSLTEGFGLAICEAMSKGIPVIASAVGGAPEIIEHGKTGWLLAKPEPRQLADLIIEASLLSHDTLVTIARHANLSVRTRFSPENYLKQCEVLYRELLGERK